MPISNSVFKNGSKMKCFRQCGYLLSLLFIKIAELLFQAFTFLEKDGDKDDDNDALRNPYIKVYVPFKATTSFFLET